MSSSRNELGDFLKARRAELAPRAVGLPDSGGQRRVAGLRREEVARLAAISTDYYTRLEQGRLPASAPVLEALAEALRLDEDQRRYLSGLAGKETARPRRRTVQKVQPQLRRVVDDLTSTPAIVMGRRMDVIAWNPLAAALITDFGQVPESTAITCGFFSPTRRCAACMRTGKASRVPRSRNSGWRRRNTPTIRA